MYQISLRIFIVGFCALFSSFTWSLNDDLYHDLRKQGQVDPIQAINRMNQYFDKYPDSTLSKNSVALRVYLFEITENFNELQKAISESEGILLSPIQNYDLQKGKAFLLKAQGRYTEAVSWIDEAIETARLMKSSSLEAQALSSKAVLLAYDGKIDQAQSIAIDAFSLLSDGTPLYTKAIVNSAISEVYKTANNPTEAFSYNQNAMDAMSSLGNLQQLSIYHYNQALLHEMTENYRDALQSHHTSLRYALEAEDHIGSAYALFGAGKMETRLGDYESSLSTLEKSMASFKKIGDLGMYANAAIEASFSAIKINQLTKAQKLLDQAKSIDKDLFDRIFKDLRIRHLEAQTLLYEQKGNWQAAYQTQSNLLQTQKEVWQEMLDKQLAESRIKLETELAEKSIESLKTENQLKALQLSELEQDKQVYFLGAIFATVFIVTLTVILLHIIALKRKLENFNHIDELTRLSNRDHIQKMASQEFNRAIRQQRTLTVALFDIDMFLLMQDQHGVHHADEVIRVVAQVADSVIRPNDRLGRLDQERFLLILPDLGKEKSASQLELLRSKIKELKPDAIEGEEVTVSIGASLFNSEDENVDDMIEKATQALYIAKAHGGNFVEFR